MIDKSYNSSIDSLSSPSNYNNRNNVNNTNSCLKIYLLNARSIVNKIDFLSSFLNNNVFDFIFITETWLNLVYLDSFIIDTTLFSIIRGDRLSGRGGGVAVVFNNAIANRITNVDIANQNNDTGFEIICLNFHITKYKFIKYICVYLPPQNAKDIDIIYNLLNVLRDQICSSNSEYYIMGISILIMAF